jgi:hypothetical protein
MPFLATESSFSSTPTFLRYRRRLVMSLGDDGRSASEVARDAVGGLVEGKASGKEDSEKRGAYCLVDNGERRWRWEMHGGSDGSSSFVQRWTGEYGGQQREGDEEGNAHLGVEQCQQTASGAGEGLQVVVRPDQ